MMATSPRTDGRSARLGAYRQAEGVRGSTEREAEILKHLPLVHTVVDRVASHLPPNVDRDDLFHAGVIGLMDALTRFDVTRDNAFSTYAVMRIRGAIIDELRARDWIPRSARERSRDYQRAVADLAGKLGRSPTDAELAKALDVPESELDEIERSAHLATQVSLEQPIGGGDDGTVIGNLLPAREGEDTDPARFMQRDDLRKVLAKVLATLTEQERLIIKMYYFEHLLLKEIAAVLGVTESRVCQIHGRIMGVLRARMTQHL
jgi:RNA polymerase sigma factor for flagellar operon FliA